MKLLLLLSILFFVSNPIMIDSQDMNDLQLEDVEDYTADYPIGSPQSENIHQTAYDDTPTSSSYRRSKITELVLANKYIVGIGCIVVILLISIVATASGGGNSKYDAPANGNGDGLGTTTQHQPPITVDPSTLDPEVTSSLMKTLLGLYDRHNLDPAVLESESTPQRKAFYWLATDENLDDMDHTQKSQRFALATFYYATNAVTTPYTDNPKPWQSAHLWLSTAHVCEWKGIVCNTQQHVQAISLERNNLSGTIPKEVTILAGHLVEIDLTSNLVHMKEDDFDAFTTLENLEILLLDDNYLVSEHGLPSQFGALTSVEKLRLSYNLFAGELERDHKVLENMGKLTHLEIESNFLTGTMPSIIGDMEDLVYLYMRRNEMKFNLDFLKSGNLDSLCK